MIAKPVDNDDKLDRRRMTDDSISRGTTHPRRADSCVLPPAPQGVKTTNEMEANEHLARRLSNAARVSTLLDATS